MTAAPSGAASGAPQPASAWILFPVTAAIFVSFLTLGLSFAVPPLHVHDTLRMSTLMVGVIGGSQFVAALLSRAPAGAIADLRGAKRAVMLGFLAASIGGLLYAASLALGGGSAPAVALLLLARVALGCSESLVVTGALTWGLVLVGIGRAGIVMSWTGMSMFAAYAIGAPLGGAIHARWGFAGVATATALLPSIAWAALVRRPAPKPSSTARVPFYKVLRAVWLPGLGLTFCAVGFGAITTFVALLFASRAWGSPALAITAFGVAFIAARLLFDDLPDRIGGARVALVCVLIEVVGQGLIWLAGVPWMAYLGAALTGFGYSLAFPGFGVEAVRRAPPQSRGAAMGAYVAFLDLSLGATGPVLGAAAGAWGLPSVYLGGAVAALASFFVAWRLLARPAPRPA